MNTLYKKTLALGTIAAIAFSQMTTFARGGYRQEIESLLNIDTSYTYLEQYCEYNPSFDKFMDCEGTYGIYEDRLVPKIQQLVDNMIDNSPSLDAASSLIENLDQKLIALKKRSPLTRTKFLIELIQQEFALGINSFMDSDDDYDDDMYCSYDCPGGGCGGSRMLCDDHDDEEEFFDADDAIVIRRTDNYQSNTMSNIDLTTQAVEIPVYIGYIQNTSDRRIAIEQIAFDLSQSTNVDLDSHKFTFMIGQKQGQRDCSLEIHDSGHGGDDYVEFNHLGTIEPGQILNFCVTVSLSSHDIIDAQQKGDIVVMLAQGENDFSTVAEDY